MRLSRWQGFYIAVIIAVIIGPFFPLLIQSFAFRWAWPDLWPSTWWWEARARALTPIGWDYVLSPYSRLGEALWNTLWIGVAVSLFSLVIALPAAQVLTRGAFRGKALVEGYLALPLLVPEMAMGMSLLMIFIALGWAGSPAAVILVQMILTTPYMLRMLMAVYEGLDPNYEEQARVLGARPPQVFWQVTLPLLMPGVMAGLLFAFLVSSNIFVLTFMMGQGQIVTLPTLLFSKISGGQIDASAAGITLIAALPGIVFLWVADRFIREEAFARGLGAH